MLEISKDKERLKTQNIQMSEIAATYQFLNEQLYKDLFDEFQGQLVAWDAEIEQHTNIVRFREPEVLFAPGQSVLRPGFEDILRDFFPRYVRILSSSKYRSDIEEIRIEGHTSKDWEGTSDEGLIYLRNAKLSQERAFEVLRFCFALPAVAPEKNWLVSVLRANGLSYAKLVLDANLTEVKARSRRVEFRVLTKSQERIWQVLKVAEQGA